MAKTQNKKASADFAELNRIVRPKEAARLSGLSWDTLRRNQRQHVIRMGPRASGMRLRHVLGLAEDRT
jgi:hypothetical protein